ncbi:hypothetical protein V6N13_140567 [Hibiscus sabdariffa]
MASSICIRGGGAIAANLCMTGVDNNAANSRHFQTPMASTISATATHGKLATTVGSSTAPARGPTSHNHASLQKSTNRPSPKFQIRPSRTQSQNGLIPLYK